MFAPAMLRHYLNGHWIRHKVEGIVQGVGVVHGDTGKARQRRRVQLGRGCAGEVQGAEEVGKDRGVYHGHHEVGERVPIQGQRCYTARKRSAGFCSCNAP